MKKLTAIIALLFCGFVHAQENYNLVQRGHLTFPGKELANIGGYVDSLGNEYALVGTTTGLSIVNVTNPDNPVLSFEVNGVTNVWREVKTWQGFAYVTTEGTNGGLTIVDLRELPASINSQVYRGDGAINNLLSTSHALHIDNGYCYVYGSNIGVKGILILDLTDPWNPVYRGRYNDLYVHDGFVSGDTAWACNIYNGIYTVIDVSDKANPVTLASQSTPGNFTHNSWLTDDHNTLLTTDEVENSYLVSYDINDLGNITELDRYQTAPGTNSIVHNTHVLNDYAVTSWYTEGVVIVDAARPNNLIEVAKNDFTSFEGNTFNGCWGVYPFLPSGNLVASDIEGGLYVLTPTYVRGCYLEGTVRDAACGANLEGVTVSIVEQNVSEQTDINGIYRTGTAIPGTYTITFSKPGYTTQTMTNVVMTNGQLTTFDIQLSSPTSITLNGNVDNINGGAISGALVSLVDANASEQLTADANGTYSKCDAQPGTYQLAVGQWGFVTSCTSNFDLNTTTANVSTVLNYGYYDDFQFNFGWTVTSTTATGIFQRAIPAATTLNGVASNPGVDVGGDCNGFAYVSGNAVGTGAGSDDIDDGYTRLTSPVMDMNNSIDPYIHYSRWFFNAGGNDAANDTMYIQVSNNNGNPITVKKIVQDASASQWVEEAFRLRDFIAQPQLVRFIVQAQDFPNGHILEAGLDRFYVSDSFTVNLPNTFSNEGVLNAYPNPSSEAVSIRWKMNESSALLQLQLVDMSGRLVQQQRLNGMEGITQIGAELPSGVYIVRLCSDGRALSNKRIVLTH
jgi:choice-of-anchor B domain-containing protein